MSVLSVLAAAAIGLPGAHTVKVCDAAGPYWPTMTLAVRGSSAWVACKEQSRVLRVTGTTVKPVRLTGPAIAVASGLGSIWALDSGGTLYRIDATSGRIAKRIYLQARAAYNVWIGGGSVWVADDQGAEVVRVSPRTNRVVARVAVGDGPADMAFSGNTAWVIDHRDRTLFRIDLRTNRPARLSTLPGDAPERMVWASGSLWVTGRGTALLKVNPADGSVMTTIDIGGTGIDIATSGDDLWIPTRSYDIDQSGFPTLTALKRVSLTSAAVATVATATSRVDVHGIVAGKGFVWLADNTNGFLYRVP